MASIENIRYIEIPDFEVRCSEYNKETKETRISSYKVLKAYGVMGVKPNWVQLVVHRPLADQSYRSAGSVNSMIPKEETWVVCERETTSLAWRPIEASDGRGNGYKVRSRDEAVMFALEKLERVGKEKVLNQLKIMSP